ncbi:hypothetical protein AV274_4211 [Blastocystis sp. ATCC 50177/Nand II]|uniref:TFIIS N-terminal domain-containing protein n=1 Tax=Blastocystis sp. subtype 1 (strain ATCC 50177 / NandII) TaxID=478820 RepID=A0A196SAU4_BLAHN|nr:hypothetical protein AV274_4211 [Blastocystis sp. ATCC 50177/Nand II]
MEPSSSEPKQDQRRTMDHEEEAVFGDESEDSAPQTHPKEDQEEMTAAEKEKYDRIRSDAFGNDLEAAIEDKDDEPAKKPKKKNGELSDNEQRLLVKRAIEYVHRMDEAYVKDLEAFSNGEVVDNRLKMIRDVERSMKDTDFARCCLSCGLIPVLAKWIRPGAHGNLPFSRIRSGVYNVLLELPVRKNNIKEGNMGELLVKLWMNKKETEENHATLHQIIEKWLRLVTGMSDSFREEANEGLEDIAASKKEYLSAVNRRRNKGFSQEQEERSIFAMMPRGELRAYVNDAPSIPIRQEPKGRDDSAYAVLSKMERNPRKRAR